MYQTTTLSPARIVLPRRCTSRAAERDEPVPLGLRAVEEDLRQLGVGVADAAVAPLDQPSGVGLRHTEQPFEHADRQLFRDLLDEVELAERQGAVEHDSRQLAE